MRAPKWARYERTHDRSDGRAARVAALYILRNEMPDVSKKDMAQALGISRWTLDRDLSSVPEVEKIIATILSSIGQLKEDE